MKKILEIKGYSKKLIDLIVDCLNKDKVIIMPSDTIYGFLTKTKNEQRLREIKRRDEKPFLHLISRYSQLSLLNIDPEIYIEILQKNWPGNISFIMNDINNKKLGVRMPDFEELRNILDRVNEPLLSTSVNFSGMNTLNNPEDIIKNFSELVDLIIIDKNFKEKLASTIVDLTTSPYTIIRKGDKEFIC
ncbi:MAG TPA: L-threonylcarbamoyladenylate synthase [Spirochaetota bacterium]|nr:L-threonylcarbamoyladenylate synthase [Spirochaetota bacterium]HOL56436.1 L-threonylcarbamoyladenylate synthase [Spirochaetota bacterium]HPP05369.1 L-threonylcarbamoyladenylate synthase [Spirochaetota bacterium]